VKPIDSYQFTARFYRARRVFSGACGAGDATDWRAGNATQDLRFGQDIWNNLDKKERVQISVVLSVSKPALRPTTSCPMGTGGPFPGVKRGRGVTLTTHTI